PANTQAQSWRAPRHRMVPEAGNVSDDPRARIPVPRGELAEGHDERQDCGGAHMKWLVPCLLASIALPAYAQSPFDMSPERPGVEDAAPVPSLPASPGADLTFPSEGQPTAGADTPAAWSAHRFLLPEPEFMLSGETATR